MWFCWFSSFYVMVNSITWDWSIRWKKKCGDVMLGTWKVLYNILNNWMIKWLVLCLGCSALKGRILIKGNYICILYRYSKRDSFLSWVVILLCGAAAQCEQDEGQAIGRKQWICGYNHNVNSFVPHSLEIWRECSSSFMLSCMNMLYNEIKPSTYKHVRLLACSCLWVSKS